MSETLPISPQADATPTEDPSAAEVLALWARHLTSLVFPLSATLFLATGPHPWWLAPWFVLPMVFTYHQDVGGAAELRQPARGLPAWPFDGLVYGLIALQLLNVFLLARLFAVQSVFSMDFLVSFLVVGSASGFSIINAHELIHRRGWLDRTLGRLQLCTVLYEHFYTEHLRGHHVQVATPADPATARFGESYEAFWRRTVPAQFRSAWRLECRRLGDEGMPLLDRRQLGNRVLHGIAVEWGLAFAILAGAGVAAFLAFLAQAFGAVRLLEVVNYFEHWGLERRGPRVGPLDSWDTYARFTYYGLTGLSRHADHHARPSRPYQQLRVREGSPLLPFGYVGTIVLAMDHNDEFQRLMTAELKRRGLGPFREAAAGS